MSTVYYIELTEAGTVRIAETERSEVQQAHGFRVGNRWVMPLEIIHEPETAAAMLARVSSETGGIAD